MSGSITFSAYPSVQQPINDSSCISARQAAQSLLNQYGDSTYITLGCSSDPVRSGTLVHMRKGSQSSDWMVNSISQGLPTNSNLPDFNSDSLSSLLIIGVSIILFFIGFHTGMTSGK